MSSSRTAGTTGGGSDTPTNIYAQIVVEVDGGWGPYGRCNPDTTAPGGWRCQYGNPYTSQAGGGVPDPQRCQPAHCPRTARTVGWAPKNVRVLIRTKPYTSSSVLVRTNPY